MCFNYVAFYFIWIFYSQTKHLEYTFIFMIINGVFATFIYAFGYVSYETHVAKISDKEIPGTFMNVINGVSNFSDEWHKPIIFYILDYVNYTLLVICGLCYTIGYLKLTDKWVKKV